MFLLISNLLSWFHQDADSFPENFVKTDTEDGCPLHREMNEDPFKT